MTRLDLMREAVKNHKWSLDATPKDWFDFLADHGWTGKEYRLAIDQLRVGRGPQRPCSLCKRHHDTLQDADFCAKLPVRLHRQPPRSVTS